MKLLYLLVPTIIALFFGCKYLFKPKNKSAATNVLAGYFFLFVVSLLGLLVLSNEEWAESTLANITSLLFFVALLAIPPTMYLYVYYLSGKKSHTSRTTLLHYIIPIILLGINVISFFQLNGVEEAQDFTQKASEELMSYANGYSLLYIFPILNVFYIIRTIILYKDHRKVIGNVYSYEAGINLKWMLTFIIGYVLFMFCLILLQASLPQFIQIVIGLLIIGYFLFVGIKGDFEITELNDENEPQQDPISVQLDDAKMIEIKSNVLQVMEKEEPFLNSKLTVHELAKMTRTNSKYLSRMLNSEFQKNFVTFINSYRIAKAKDLLVSRENENFTIEAIAQMSGFNSKSAFNNAFKNITGKTPSAFKKEAKI